MILTESPAARRSERADTLRVFLDANVLFSAAYREGSGLVRLWENSSVRLVTSPYALEEAERNIARKRPDALPRLHRLVVGFEVSSHAGRLPDAHGLPEKDRPILAAAIGARCAVLLTGDVADFGHLIGSAVASVRVMTPRELFAELSSASGLTEPE